MGDAALLEQVLFNLLDNAGKYGGPNQPATIYAREDEGCSGRKTCLKCL